MPKITLQVLRNGLLLEVQVGLSAARRAQMWKQGRPIPPAVPATFIIDTGADTSMVDDQLMRILGLTPTSQTQLLTSGSQGVPEDCDVYDIELEVLGRNGQPSWKLQPLEVLARPLLNQSTSGMIGRDVLNLAVLEYNGPAQTFSLTYPDAPIDRQDDPD